MSAESRTNTLRQRAKATEQKAKQKKLVFAVCLLALMGVLWVRVFAKKKPANAVASTAYSYQQTVEVKTGGITYRHLPYVAGRHDAMVRDMFSSRDWKGFTRPGQSDDYASTELGYGVNDSGIAAEIVAAAKDLELIAIVTDNGYQAFIENHLLSKGQSFNFKFNGQKYKFVVINIHEDRVELNCKGVTVTKKMPQSSMVTE